MGRGENRGFSLLELMIVVVIIGIFASIAIPHIMEEKRRGALLDLTNSVEQSAVQVRSFAMRTRKASVLEFDGTSNKIWMNVLNGPNCWDNIENCCMHAIGQNVRSTFSLRDNYYKNSDVYMCDVQGLAISSGASPACAASSVPANADGSFALCYSGRGELFVRGGLGPGGDCATNCGTTVVAGRASWNRACSAVGSAFSSLSDGGTSAPPLSGFVLRFNRLSAAANNNCKVNALDVMREVHLPAGATPFSRVGLSN